MQSHLIDFSYLEEVCAGDRDLILEMVGIFLDQVKEFTEAFETLNGEMKFYDLGLMAHKAKSSVAIMGMKDLTIKLKELEIKAKEGIETGSYNDYINDFREQTRIAEEELKEYINNLK